LLWKSLGVLGMLPPDDISSTDPNLGLNDIKTGLRFFKGLASSFGGDPDKITVGGHSSGGHMVRGEYEKTTRCTVLLVCAVGNSGFDWVISGLLASPEMEGKFRAAIFQSDPMVCIATFPPAYDKRF
jgi:carboxylesterase type B